MKALLRQHGVRLMALIAVAGPAAAALMVALQRGVLWAAVVPGGAIAGLMLGVARTIQPSAPRLAAMLRGGAVIPVALLALMSPMAGAVSLAIAAGLIVAWVVATPRPVPPPRPRTSTSAKAPAAVLHPASTVRSP